MSRLSNVIRQIAILTVPVLILFTACDNIEEPTGVQNQPAAETITVELDAGELQVIETNPALAKSFQAQSYCPLTGMKIAYDMSHNSGRQALTSPTGSNLNSTIFGDYTSRGATITVITTFTLAVLNQYDVLWLEEDHLNALTAAEQTDLQAFVSGGGSVVVLAEDWAGASALTPLGYGYTTPGANGTTSNIATHPLTMGVSTINFASTSKALTEPGGAMWLVKNTAGTGVYISASMYGSGKVIVMSDEFLVDGTVTQNDNRVFGNNIMTWFWTHQVTIDIHPGGYPNSINCSGKGNGVITVAIITTSSFDATDVDHTSVMFEGATESHVNKKTGVVTRHEEDVDLDGDLDLVLHFKYNDTSLDCSSTTGEVTGMTYNGHCIKGMDTVNMVP